MSDREDSLSLRGRVGDKKFCIFCGEKPVAKNKEHVLPTWLIEVTGSPGRSFNLGLPGVKSPEMNFASFVFPACKVCNDEFSNLEGSAKTVIAKLLAANDILPAEATILLDWLDKVRVGLWLAGLVMSKNPLGIPAKYHISQRVKKYDRCVLIYSFATARRSLIAFASNTPAFHVMPSCFTLQINNLLLFNVSTFMLLAARLGLPFVGLSRYDGLAETLHVEIAAGYRKRKFPLLRTQLERPALELYQPMLAPGDPFFPDGSPLIAESIYDSPFVRESCRDFGSREGHIFIQSAGAISKFDSGTLGLDLARQGPILYGDKRYQNIVVQTFRFQEKLVSTIPEDIEYQLLSDSEKLFFRQLAKNTKRYNDMISRALREHFLF